MQMLQIRWPALDAQVRVRPLVEEAPELSRALLGALPFTSVQGHALITGPMLFTPTRVSVPVRENVALFTEMPLGACWYGSASQNLGIVYGPLTEPEGFSVWGQVHEDDLPTLQKVGRAVWSNLMRPNAHPALAEPDHAAGPWKMRILVEHTLVEDE
jgi:hypothetical protein